MYDKRIKLFVILTAILFLVAGFVLFILFDKQGINKNKTNGYINYNVNDYIEISPVVFNNYTDVYNSINVSRITFINDDENIFDTFLSRQEEIIGYISGYYDEISKSNTSDIPVSSVSSIIKAQFNGAVLSIFYKMDFILDKNVYSDNIKSYFITFNVDLRTNRVLSNDDLLSKYNYSKEYIVDKVFTEDILIDKGQIVIDKDTNMSLTRGDIERKKDNYVNRIISEFDNIIDIYVENGSLVLAYNVADLKAVFFDNKFDVDIKFRYLK